MQTIKFTVNTTLTFDGESRTIRGIYWSHLYDAFMYEFDTGETRFVDDVDSHPEDYYMPEEDFNGKELLSALYNLSDNQLEFPLIIELEDHPDSTWTINEVCLRKGFVILRSTEW